MQAYIKYKAYSDKKNQGFKTQTNRFRLHLTAKTDYHGSKIFLTDFQWIGRHIIEKVLPNNK